MPTIRRTLAAATTGLFLLAACSSGPSAAGPDAGEPVAGGSLTWAVETEPITFNPHQYAQAKARLLVFNQFDALLTHDDKGGYLPWLASSYTASPDGLAYTLTLRRDVTFHDGERFDAQAVKANLDKLVEPGYAPTVAAVQLKNLAAVDVVDPYTVRLRLTTPDVLILDFLASPQGAQISPRSLRQAADLKAGGPDVVGTGPFVLDRYTKGRDVHYSRNQAYAWAPSNAAQQGPAYLSEVTYRFLKESSVRVGALASGQVNVIEGVPAVDQPLVEGDPHLRLTRQLNAGTSYGYYFNLSRAPFDDVRVRRAFRDALDVPAVLQAVYRGTATRAWSIVGPTSAFYDRTREGTYSGDAARANSLLDEAGWTARDGDGFRVRDGHRLTARLVQAAPFVRDRRDVLAQAVQAAVKQSAGIDLQVRVVDQGTATAAFNGNEYEVFDNSRADTDVGAALNLLVDSNAQPGRPAAAINRAFFSNADVDGWLRAAQASGDTARRTDLYGKVQRAVVTDHAIVLPLYAPADQIGSSKTVGGLRFEPTAGVPGSAYGVWTGRS